MIGVWDGATKTCTLIVDVNDQINLDSDGLTLDGGGHSVSGSFTSGVYASYRTGIVVKNVVVSGPTYGIYMSNSGSSTVSGNTVSNSYYGIRLSSSVSSTVTGNNVMASGGRYCIYLYKSGSSTVSGNMVSGSDIYLSLSSGSTVSDNTVAGVISLSSSSGSTVSGNMVSSDYTPIYVYFSGGSTVSGNIVSAGGLANGIALVNSGSSTVSENAVSVSGSYETWGIWLQGGSGTIVSGNTATGGSIGLRLYGSVGDTVTGNTVSDAQTGIELDASDSNIIFNNNFIDNQIQAYIVSGSGNIFNLPKPVGGNYWSDWTAPDIDGDGFVDNPYVFTGAQDDLPWTKKNGWLDNTPPETTLTIGEPNWLSIDTTFTYVTSATSFTLTAVDDGSGVYGTYYRIDGGDWVDYAGMPFTLGYCTLGSHTVDYYSVDKMGNVEAFKSATISLISPITAKGWADNVPIYDKAGNLLTNIDHTSSFRITGSLEGIVLLQVHNDGPKTLSITEVEVRGVSPPQAGTGTATLLSVPPQISMFENKSFLADVSVTGLWHGTVILRLWVYFTIEGVEYHISMNVQFRA